MKKKYYITCLSEDDIDLIIKQLITPGISPDNTNITEFVPIEDYIGISPNTIIVELTEEQVQELKNNQLIDSITEVTEDIVNKFTTTILNPVYSSVNDGTHSNWGMARCNSISAIPPWDNTFTRNKWGTNVDVVIIDSGIVTNHPEFLDQNSNSRVNKINWSFFHPLTSSTDLNVSFADNNYVMNGEVDPTLYVVSDKFNSTVYRTQVYNFNLDSTITNDPLYIGPAIGVPFSSTYVENNGASTGTIKLSVFASNRPEYTANQNVMYYWSGRDSSINGIITRTKYNTQPDDNLFYTDIDGHGTHTAGTVAGNVFGWAPSANIYAIHIDFGGDPGGYAANTTGMIEVYNMLKGWHNKKKQDGNNNPTVTNNSYGWNGVVYNNVNLAVKSLTDAGIHFVHSAGNSSAFITVPTDPTFNLIRKGNGNVNHISQEASPSYPNTLWTNQLDNPVICVGALGDYDSNRPHTRAIYSNYGPGVSLYAPGTWINSASYNNQGAPYPGVPGFYCIKYSGTSMAGPQVAGVLATILDDLPQLTPLQAKSWLLQNCVIDAISATNDSLYMGGGYYDNTRLYTLSGGANKTLLKYPAKKIVVGLNNNEFANYMTYCYKKSDSVNLDNLTFNSSLSYMNDSEDLIFGPSCP